MTEKVEISNVSWSWLIVAPCSWLSYGFFVSTASIVIVQSALYLAEDSDELSCC